MKHLFLMLVLLFVATSVFAGQAEIIDVRVEDEGDGHYAFIVTVRHDDQGWDHYVDKFEVVAPDGKVLGTRVLAHPHVNEQPFTRSLHRVRIQADIKKVFLRVHDSVHGYGDKTKLVALPN